MSVTVTSSSTTMTSLRTRPDVTYAVLTAPSRKATWVSASGPWVGTGVVEGSEDPDAPPETVSEGDTDDDREEWCTTVSSTMLPAAGLGVSEISDVALRDTVGTFCADADDWGAGGAAGCGAL